MSIGKELKRMDLTVSEKSPKQTKPVWRGPEVDGITYSLLSKWLNCRERFRVYVCEGLTSAGGDGFPHRIEYGQMWHVCEEALAKGNPLVMPWQHALSAYAASIRNVYGPHHQETITHWYVVCKLQFQHYIDYWAKHPDVVDRRPLLQEQVFDVPYKLPSGRTVRLRGKWDSVDLIGKGKAAGIYLQENKTKGDIRQDLIARQLTFDLQTMIYMVALQIAWDNQEWCNGILGDSPILGVRYNIIRRPFSGGRGSIVRHKPTKSDPRGESLASFYGRLSKIIEDDPGYWFMRWTVQVHPQDIARFRQRCLDPILEQLCDWWNYVEDCRLTDSSGGDPLWNPYNLGVGYQTNSMHWQHPFGVYNSLDEGGATDLDEYLATGSTVGLERVESLFPELEETNNAED